MMAKASAANYRLGPVVGMVNLNLGSNLEIGERRRNPCVK